MVVFQLRSMLEQAGYKDRLDTLTMVRTYFHVMTTFQRLVEGT